MANLSLKQKVRYVPNIPGNRAAPEAEQISLSITAGLSSLEVAAVMRAVNEAVEAVAKDDQKAGELITAALSPAVELNPTSTTVDGAEVQTLAQYVDAVLLKQRGGSLFGELVREVNRVNSVEGERELFFGPSSGTATTP